MRHRTRGLARRRSARGIATRAAVHGVLLALGIVASASASAEQGASTESPQALEERVARLEEALVRSNAASARDGSWTRRIRLGGSAEIAWFEGGNDTSFDPSTFLIWDTRLFLDADLGDRVALFDRTVFRNIAFTFEWDLVRRGDLENRVGEIYADFQGVLGAGDALSIQLGRFQIPVGEAYLRYSQGRPTKPFVSDPVGGPWWWDEGVRLYGSFADGRFGYVASVSDGDTAFNRNSSSEEQLTLKLYVRPTYWLYLSVSGLRSGRAGTDDSAASSALWLGESWARAFGSGSGVDNYQDGVIVPDGPNELRNTWFAGADAIVELDDQLRIWLAYGRYSIDSQGGALYDRVLHYWIAEAVVEGAWASPLLRPFYFGLRASGLGTYERDEGYLLDRAQSGTLGWNARAITDYSGVVGWRINDWVRLILEYTHRDIDLVRGVSQAIRNDAEDVDLFAAEIGVAF